MFSLFRQSSVDDLVKLARQFDENMQQDQETSEQLNTINNNLNDCGNTSETKPRGTSFPNTVKDPKCISSSGQVEAELHALFDCSTQKMSGRLSQGSSTSACSQDIKDQPVTSTSAKTTKSATSSSEKSGPAAHPAGEKGSCGFSANSCDDFDDDWENDDLLNDSFVLAMTQNPDQQHNTNPKTTLQNTKKDNTQFTSACKPSANANPERQHLNLHSKPGFSALQELCPSPKTTNRSTFKLEPNPHFQPKAAAKEASKSSFTVIQPKPQMSTKRQSAPQTDKITKVQKKTCVSSDSAKDISDTLWDDGDDDALLYQVCDSVEKISNSQPQQVSPNICQEEQDTAADRPRKTTAPMKACSSAKRQSPCAFVRSNSLPETSCGAVSYQGWNVPMKGANNKSRMSQSLPGSHMSLGTFSQCQDSSGTFQARNANVDMKSQTVTAKAPQKSHHTAFKRNVTDSAVTSNKGKLSECLNGLDSNDITTISTKYFKLNASLTFYTACFGSFLAIKSH